VLVTLLAAAPLTKGGVLHAQGAGCTTIDPPCPPPAQYAIDLQLSGDTVHTSSATAWFNVSGFKSTANASVTATLNGAQVPVTTWSFDVGGATASGSVALSLISGQNTVTVQFCDSFDGCISATGAVYYLAPPPPPAQGPPLVATEPASQFRRALGDCAGCANMVLSYSTPAYRSLDTDRSLRLVYSSALSAPTGLVALDVNPNSSTLPDRISLSLLNSAGSPVALTTGGTEVYYTAGPGPNRVTAQFDASSYASGAYNMTAVVRNWWGSSMLETRLPVRVLLINQRNSGFGSGWSVAGVPRIVINAANDALIMDGTDAVVFPSCGAGCWTPPPDESSTLSHPGSSIERRLADGTIERFDQSSGLLTQIQNRFGLATNFAYDGYGRLYQITDPAGAVTSISWTGAPGASSTANITTPGGRVTRLQTDGSGQLYDITDPDGASALTVSYSANRITWMSDRLGAMSDIQYDAYGALASVTGPAVETTDRGYARSIVTYGSREIAALPAPGSGGAGTPGSRVFPDSVWLRVRSQCGDSLRVSANGQGDPTAVVSRNAQGKLEQTVITYNSAGQPTNIVSTSGTQVSYVWNGTRLSRMTDLVTGLSTEYAYSAYGQPTVTWVNGNVQEQNFYSPDTRSVLDSSRVGDAVARFTYDAVGRPLTMADGEAHRTTLTYQTTGFLNLASLSKDSKTSYFAYDVYGRLMSVTDPAGRRDTTQMDAVNRIVRAVAPDLSVSSWTYDDASHIYGFTDAKGQLYRSTTNVLGQVTFRFDPANHSDSYRYDSDGNLSSTTSRGGRMVTVVRDLQGRPTQVTAGSLTTTIAYDTAGKWTAYSNGESTDTVFTDGSGRMAKQVSNRNGQVFVLTSEYGDLGERRKLTATGSMWSASREMLFGVDSIGRPNFVGDPAGYGTSIAYNRDHRPQTITLPTGTTTTRLRLTYGYGGNDRVTNATSSILPEQLSWSYGYDVLDRLRTLVRGVENASTQRTASYDLQGRLSRASDSSVTSSTRPVCDDPMDLSTCHDELDEQWTALRDESYSYDAVGNRTDHGAAITTGNRLTTFDGNTMTYDTDGNMLTKSGPAGNWSFAWNGLGQLESVTKNGVTTSFGYDGLGRRVRKTTNGVTTRFLYDGDNIVARLDAAGQPVLEFSYYPGVDHPHAVRQTSTGRLLYYVTAQPGHVVALVDRNNQIANSYEYTPFGVAISASEQVAQPFRFGARELDSETGLYYNRARYYDPALGRFISEDPIGLEGGVNQYAYAGNDPVNFRDPTGTCASGQELVIEVDEATGEWTARCEGPGAASGTAYLPPTVTTGTNDGRDPSGVSPNFGNPCARGGICGSSVSARGMGLPSGGTAAPSSAPANRACVEATVMLGLSAAGDIAFFAGGIAPAIRLAGAGMRYAKAADFFATTARYAATNRAAVAIANRNAAFKLVGSTLVGAYAGTFSDQGIQLMSTQGEGVTWEDFVPGIATLKAYRQRSAACAR